MMLKMLMMTLFYCHLLLEHDQLSSTSNTVFLTQESHSTITTSTRVPLPIHLSYCISCSYSPMSITTPKKMDYVYDLAPSYALLRAVTIY